MINIIPYPQKITCGQGRFDLKDCNICVQAQMDYRVVAAAVELRDTISQVSGSFCGFYGTVRQPQPGQIRIITDPALPREGYRLSVTQQCIVAAGADAAGCFYAIQTLTQLLADSDGWLPVLEITDYPDMAYRGYYHDTTRGRVPTVNGVKKLVDTLARYKLNSLQLYVEHSFDFREFRDTGRTDADYLTAQEILEIDRYCYDHFVDFIPSLSTFGHLYELLSLERYQHLCELENFQPSHHFWYERMLHHTIDPSNPESWEVIRSLIDQYLPLFRSKYFNICCDETFDLCKGRNAGKEVGKVYVDFVEKIASYVKAQGKTVMMWGDIALEHPEYICTLPADTVVLNWSYEPQPDEQKVATIAKHDLPQIICPGTTSWARLLELVSTGRPNIYLQAQYAYTYGALGLLNTNWGDFGHPASFQCALYGTVMGAAISWNRSTRFDAAFELAVSRRVWGEEINVPALIEKLAAAQEVTPRATLWHQLVEWTQTRDASRLTLSREQAERAVALCGEQLAILAARKPSKEMEHLLVAAEGIALLNSAAVHILSSASFAGWTEAAEHWLSGYEKLWLEECKPSELRQIRSFIMDIPA